MSGFKKAVKVQLKGRVALCGISGSGKTLTALKIARGMCPTGEIALIDSERGSASKYADMFDFNVKELDTFHPNTYIQAITEAKGHDVLIIDSLSHAWMGKDGALEQVDRAAARSQSKNTFTAWRDVTPLHNALVDAILSFPGHVIVTMRSKADYVMEDNGKGKMTPVKVGLAPIQREGIEYEFDLVADMTLDNTMIVTKTRDKQFRLAVIPSPTEQVGADFAMWLNSGPVREAEPKPEPTTTTGDLPAITEEDRTNRRKWRAQVNKAGQGSATLEDIEKYRAHFVEKMGAFFEQFTYHNQVETFRSLLDEHAQRIKDEAQSRSPEAIKEWVGKMQASKTAQDFADFVKVYNRLDYLHSVEVEQELQDTAKAFGFEHYEDAIAEKAA